MLLETGGHRSTERVPEPVVTILDIKCPGSGEDGEMDWENLERLRPRDEVKFVIKDRVDYEFARDVIARHELAVARGGHPHVTRSTACSTRARCPSGCWPIAAGARAAAAPQVHLGRPREFVALTHVSAIVRPAVVLLSGGLDSYTAGAIAREARGSGCTR